MRSFGKLALGALLSFGAFSLAAGPVRAEEKKEEKKDEKKDEKHEEKKEEKK